MIKFTPGRNEDEKQFDEDMLNSITKQYLHTNEDFSHLDYELQTLFIQNQMIISMLRDLDTKIDKLDSARIRNKIVL